MTAKVRVGGALKTISSHKVMVAGVLRTVSARRVMSGGTLRTVYQTTGTLALLLSASNLDTLGSGSSLTSAAVSATPVGGVGPFSYAWTELLDLDEKVSCNSPASATTAFAATGLTVAEPVSAEWRCTVTDSLGATATADVSLTFTSTS